MAFLRVTVSLVALTGLGAASMEAQSTRAHVIAAPQGRPRIASIAPPPPPPRTLYGNGETVFQNYPVIVTPDGQVLIDLGNGYEQVARSCPYAYGYGCQSYGYPIAPQAPVLNYGYSPTTPQSGYAPASRQPSTNYAGCAPGYVPTGSYPPCIDPSRSSAASTAMPPASGVNSGGRAPAGKATTAPRVVRR